jgi:hypothetical protein
MLRREHGQTHVRANGAGRTVAAIDAPVMACRVARPRTRHAMRLRELSTDNVAHLQVTVDDGPVLTCDERWL